MSRAESGSSTILPGWIFVKSPPKWVFLPFFLIWTLGVGGGFWTLWNYKNTPGKSAVALSDWPDSSKILRLGGRSTLLMMLHPRCSCSRASLREFETVLTKAIGGVDPVLVVLKPEELPVGWESSGIWEQTAQNPGVRVFLDSAGIEAKRFNAFTSGQTFLYSSDGKLLFSGGITDSRGHVGENTGMKRVLSLINTGSADSPDHAVFGCGLL